MRRFLTLLGVVAVLAVLTSTVALAVEKIGFDTPNMPDVRLGDLYDRTTILNHGDGTVALPRPVGNGRPNVNAAALSPYVSGADNFDISGVFAQPRGGGSMYSDTQQADREIRRLIRRLD